MSRFGAVVRFVAALTLLAGGAAAQSGAFQASPWVNAPSSRVRLILPDKIAAGETMQGALELQLVPGVKTYWRNPGETGVPTTAAFDGSTGLSDIVLHYPAPGKFDDGAGGTAFGYAGFVTFPIAFRVAPGGSTAPRLTVTLDYGVCTKNMCIPAQAKIEMAPGSGTADPELAGIVQAAKRSVPQERPLGSPEVPAILSVKPEVRDGKLVLDILTRMAGDAASSQIIVDGTDYFSTDVVAAGPDRTVRFRATTSGDVEAGKPLGTVALVLSVGGSAIEVKVNLDEAAKRP